METIEDRFLGVIQASYDMYLAHGPRSTEKIKVLHGWVQDELKNELSSEYIFQGQTRYDTREAEVEGMYYNKRVDVLVSRDERELGVVSIKFITSNYRQNSINYFEQQIGETANLRRRNIVYGNLLCITDPIPYFKRDGSIGRTEHLTNRDIQRYVRLRSDHIHIHSPDVMALGIVDLDITNRRITGLTDLDKLEIEENTRRSLDNELSICSFFERMAAHIALKYDSP